MTTEVDKFFQSLPSENNQQLADVFGDKKPKEEKPPEANIPAKEGEEGAEPRKNRRHRRLEEALEAERKSNIELNERLMKVIEIKASPEAAADMPPEWVALYGDTPEAQKAWKVQQRLLESHGDRVKQDTIREMEDRQSRVQQDQKTFESFIDERLEDLEDTHNVDLTSDAPTARKARREFLEMVQNLSPKDADGTITGYADFDSAFELYQKMKTAEKPEDNTVNRAKELASKSMQASGQGAPANQTQNITPGFHGWKKDLGLE